MTARGPAPGALPPREMALAILVAAVWGVGFVAIKAGVAQAPPLFLTAVRFALAAFPGVLFIPRPKARWRDLVGYGLCIGVGQFGLLFLAIRDGMPAGLASLVIQTQAIFTIALAHVLMKQATRPRQLFGAFVALSGVAVIGLARGAEAPTAPFLSVLAAAVFWSAGNIFSIRAGRANMMGFIVWSSAFAPLPLLALSLALEDRAAIAAAILRPTFVVWGGAAFLAYGGTLIGYGLWGHLLARRPAAQVAPFALLVPVFGMASTAAVFGEPLGAGVLAGAALVLSGLAITTIAPRRS
ncbi:EamA family transporter [Rhodoblastus sp.]|jgi:O-acetylserine/cysteine efflux transporter|uniref:EamA family transporter n=1 Tax=Rhodoblastus sp. TaxID=1962975 RepID=UPI002612900B|nr:EamA family transporter [Rhodoblastus sp.]